VCIRKISYYKRVYIINRVFGSLIPNIIFFFFVCFHIIIFVEFSYKRFFSVISFFFIFVEFSYKRFFLVKSFFFHFVKFWYNHKFFLYINRFIYIIYI